MKKFTSVFLAVFMMVFISGLVFGEDKVFHKDYRVKFLACADGGATIEVIAQYMHNPEREICECLGVVYNITDQAPGYSINVIINKRNLTSDEGGAVIEVYCKKTGGGTDKCRLTMKFRANGAAEHALVKVA